MTSEKKSFFRKLLGEPLVIGTLTVGLVTAVAVGTYYDDYMELYEEANKPKTEEANSNEPEGMVFTKIGENLFTLTGGVAAGDCDKIVPQMQENMTVILESPGGSLSDGACLASHFQLRNTTTVVRDTPVFNELGEVVYEPGATASEAYEGKVICASSCSIMFLGGANRYLIGDVEYGIHGPATAPGQGQGKQAPAAIESAAFRIAASLVDLLTNLGIENEKVKLLFIRVPNSSMYWLRPSDFDRFPALSELATHYIDFHGLTWASPKANLPTIN